MKKIPKIWLRVVGGLLGLFGILFVAFRFHSQAQQIDFTSFNKLTWLVMGLLAIFYGMANLLLARAWWHLLTFLNVKTSFKWASKAYGLSQLAKYIPGNIFHLAGRQSLGMAEGVPVSPLLKSVMWELGMLAFAGAMYVMLILPIVFIRLPPSLSIVIFLVTIIIIWLILDNWLGSMIGAAFFLQVSFLMVTGGGFAAILALVTPTEFSISNIPVLCGAYVLAWLTGFITPGAPAGIGVRELTLIFLLGERVEQADLLLAVVLGRVVSMAGDFFYFSTSMLLKGKVVYRVP